jgi:putative transposase
MLREGGKEMAEYSRGSHTVYDIKYHLVRITKYRYEIVTKKIAER